ncbi:MAG: circadian clock protein KaiC [Exilibacterium sp.]
MSSKKTTGMKKTIKNSLPKEHYVAGLYHNTTGANPCIPKTPSGIPGLDEVLQGGLAENRLTLVSGCTGAGKTVLSNQFLYHGIVEMNQPGVFITFEERPQDIIDNVAGFGWNYGQLIKQHKLAFVDVSDPGQEQVELNDSYDLSPLLLRIHHTIEKIGAKRVVIDSMAALFIQVSNARNVRNLFTRLCHDLKSLGVTTLATAERPESMAALARNGVEEYVADGVIELSVTPGQQRILRHLFVRKMRGVGYRSGKVEFDIHTHGMELYPKIPIDRRLAKTSLNNLKSFGIERFDELVGGGIPEGHMVLISGNTGTGKTTFGLQFALEGVKVGEPVVYVALEEPSGQIKKTALGHGWNFKRAIQSGALHFIDVPLIDISTDQLLYTIANSVIKSSCKRIVVDSISSLESATMNGEQVRQFLIQLLEFCKAQGVTCLMTYLTSGVFGAVRGQLLGQMETTDMRLSSVVDGIILLRYVERGQKVKRLLNVLKMRGRQHSKAIYLYEARKEGIWVGEKYEE